MCIIVLTSDSVSFPLVGSPQRLAEARILLAAKKDAGQASMTK